MEDKRKNKININKEKVLTNTLTGVLVVVFSAIIIGSFFVIVKPYIENKKTDEIDSSYMERIEEALVRIYSSYVEDVDMESLVEGAIAGLAQATEDPYTRYVSQEEYDEMRIAGTEKYGGLGIHITYDKEADGILVLSVMPGSPALEEGICSGDVIKKVKDIVVKYDNYYECVDNIKGEENTKVELTIQRGEETFTNEYTRKIVSVNNVESEIIEGDIGYIKILSFENNIANQFAVQYSKLRAQNISALILDLRNNPGGLVNEAVNISRLLLPKGEIVRLVYKNESDKVYSCDGKNEIDIPLMVLVNENSASASEILAGAIKDSGKGILIGDTTYGKGIVQTIKNLESEGALSVTTAKYYTASGIEIHGNGIIPNVEISLDEEFKNKYYVPKNEDLQLNKAIELINQQK